MKLIFFLGVIFFLVLGFVVTPGAHAVAPAQQGCTATLRVSAMNGGLSKSLYQDAATSQVTMAILPFAPVNASYTAIPAYFPYAFPILLADYWPPGSAVHVVDWRLTSQVMKSLSVPISEASQMSKSIQVGEELKARYVVAGSFDYYGGRVKAYVRFYDVLQKTLIDKANLTVESNLDASFLILMGEIVKGAGKAFPKVSASKTLQSELPQSVRRYNALADYLEGVVHTSAYDASHLSVAKVWLKSAIGKDYKFFQAYRELARAHYMLALLGKEQMINSSAEYLDADRELEDAKKYAPAGAKPQDFLSRYAKGQVQFASGVNLFQRGLFPEAVTALETVRTVLPEDGLSQYYLSLAYQSMGRNDLAQAPWAAANEINPCFNKAKIGVPGGP